MTPQLTRVGWAAFAAAALVSLSPKAGHAEQFTLFDVKFTMTWDDAMNSSPSKSHHYVKSNDLNPMRPTNWVTPIDYRTGKVHIYLEVLDKPAGGQMQGWALCYVGGGSYGCPYTKYYTEKGIYENDVDMTSFYNNNTIDWTKGITEVDLVYTINNSGSGHVTNFPELKDKTTPTTVRIAMVQVSKGATYDPSKLPPGMGMGGMGGAGGMGGMGGSGGGNAGMGGMSVGGSGGAAPGGFGGFLGNDGGIGGFAGAPVSTPGGGGSGGTGAVMPAGGTGTTTAGSGTGTSQDEGGCSFSSSSQRQGIAWAALAALGLALVRRRRD